MNLSQRKFLLETVQKQFKTEKEALRARQPKEPSLNNYLIAAVLDGSFQLCSHEKIRGAITKRVRDLDKSHALVSGTGNRYGYQLEEQDVVHLPVNVLFELPPAYAEELKLYEVARDAWDVEMKALEDSLRAIELKINLGSDKALSALIEQADQLCSLSLVQSNQLFLAKA